MNGTNSSTWILGVIVFLLIILLIIFLILWLVNRGKINPQNSQLAITDLNFSLENTTTIKATWESVGNSGDQITLYADTIPINFDASGKPEGDRELKTSSTVSGGAKEVSLSNLTPNTKYFLAITVTNPKFTGFNSEPGLLYTGEIPVGSFIIQEINTPGGITLDTNNDITVTYDKSVNKSDVNDIWMYNPRNFTISTRGVGANSGTTPTLFNNNGKLAAQDLSILEKNSNFISIAQWVYDKSNRWCLKSNPNICMELSTPISSSESINVREKSKTQWINLPLLEEISPISSSSNSSLSSTSNCNSDSSNCNSRSDSSSCNSRTDSSSCNSRTDSSSCNSKTSKYSSKSSDSSEYSRKSFTDSSKYSTDSSVLFGKSLSDDSFNCKKKFKRKFKF